MQSKDFRRKDTSNGDCESGNGDDDHEARKYTGPFGESLTGPRPEGLQIEMARYESTL